MADEAKTIFTDLYMTFFALPHVSVGAKYRSFETLIENLPSPQFVFWEIVGITPSALTFLAAKDFSDCKGVQRSHDMSRRDRGNALFNRAEPMPDAYEFFYRHDRTVIAMKTENDLDSFIRADVIPLENSRFGRHTYAIPETRAVRQYLAEVYADWRANL